MKRGVLPDDILKGLARYRSFCIATQKVGTEYVLQAKTFLGEKNEGWKQDWAVTESLTSSSTNEDDRDAQRRVEARRRDSKHEVETYEADEEKAKEQHDVMREFFDELPAAEQTRLKHEISHRALAIWPNGEPPAAVYRGCFAAVISEKMQEGAA